MALTQISTQGIKDGTITGTDLATNVDLVDNQKLRLGTGNDLQIYHNGSNSYIDDTGTGKLFIRSNEVRINKYTNEFMIRAIADGAVELYYDHSKKFETTSGGVQVTDNLNMSGGHIFLADNYKLNVGTGDDLQIYHDGTNDRIDSSGTFLILEANNHIFRNPAGNEDYAKFLGNGAVELYYDNVKKFQTTNGGINITGSVACSGGASNNLSLPDNGKAKFGDGDDLQIYHLSSGGGDSYITNSNGNLNIVNSTDGWIRLQPKSGEEGVIVKYDGAVELYHDNSVKLATTGAGVDINGNLNFDDNEYALFGNSNDLQIYHNGTHSFIQDTGTGNLEISSSKVAINNAANNANMATFTDGGAVTLYHNGTKKFETVAGGVKTNDNNYMGFGNSNDLKIYHDGNNNLILGSPTVLIKNNANTESYIRCNENAQVELYYNNSKQFETTSTGSTTFGTHHSTSDIALKTNIKPITNTLEKIQQITGYKYKFIKSNENSIGVVAQEVEKVFPELVAGTEGNKTLQYNGLIGVLIEAVKELSAEVAALKAA
jgi:hypothetical protein